MPEASFPSLILTLAAGALQYMGLVENPVTKSRDKDMKLAKHTIDTLGMLMEKTKGNLQKEEKKLLDELLYDLKMKYVRAKGKEGDSKESKEREQAQEVSSKKKEVG
ncbi:DUF1844 domain-containing protein [candidate division TA06 bacterium]|uniref:DUF1844 domain-containing protein n=1 Tax=candidate division TA06 bacterium TaxID=2250710 RepID=A0A523UPR7_UNCT6|nr:MAG: DUF1844 domain-containing protein [candidate division TA06 bacterium]